MCEKTWNQLFVQYTGGVTHVSLCLILNSLPVLGVGWYSVETLTEPEAFKAFQLEWCLPITCSSSLRLGVPPKESGPWKFGLRSHIEELQGKSVKSQISPSGKHNGTFLHHEFSLGCDGGRRYIDKANLTEHHFILVSLNQ